MPSIVARDEQEYFPNQGQPDPEDVRPGEFLFDVDLELEVTYRVPVFARTQVQAVATAKSWIEHDAKAAVNDAACCGEMTDLKVL